MTHGAKQLRGFGEQKSPRRKAAEIIGRCCDYPDCRRKAVRHYDGEMFCETHYNEKVTWDFNCH